MNNKNIPKRIRNRFSGMWDFPYLKLQIRDFKAKRGRDSRLKKMRGYGISKITIGITGLREIRFEITGLNNPIGEPHKCI